MDEGVTWTTFPSFTSKNLTSVIFPGTDVGFIGGASGVIYKTINGGASWILQNTGTNRKINAFCFFDVYNGYAAGDMGVILKTNDGGSNWTTLSTGTIRNLSGISFCDQNHGMAVGAFGGIYKTTNGGATWNKIFNAPYDYDLNCIKVFDQQTAIAGGGGIFKTTDGGVTWNEVGTNVPHPNAKALYFFNNYFGYFVSAGGALFYTEDGGNTLTEVMINSYPTLYAFCVNPSNKGFIAGDWGTIFKNDDVLVGAGKEKTKQKITLYPNPAKEVITVHTDQTGDFNLEILDLNGKVVKKEQVTGNYSNISISGLNKGLYIVRLLGERDVMVTKLIRE